MTDWHPPAGKAGPRRMMARAGALVRRIIGAPDYEAYLAHVRQCHPERTPLTREEFHAERLHARYSQPGNRCC